MTDNWPNEAEEGEQCPVCGWAVIRSEGVPEHPDGEHPFGMLYVHELRSQGRAGHFYVSGCTQYRNGETETWDPESEEKREVAP